MPNANSLNGFEDLDTKRSPLSASARDGIWLLDDDVSMLKALGRLMSSAGLVAEKFSDRGAFAFLTKPFEDETLVRLIHKAVAD